MFGCTFSSARFSRAATGSSKTSAGALARARICACVISASAVDRSYVRDS